MMITIPAATVGLPPAFFDWLTANGVDVPGVSAAQPFHIDSGRDLLFGTTVIGTGFELPITVPLDDYLAGWLLEQFGEHDTDVSVLDDMSSLIEQLRSAREDEKNAKARAEEARDQILSRLRIEGSSVGTVDGRPAVERKIVESKRFDTTRFRREQPETAAIYTTVSTSERLELL